MAQELASGGQGGGPRTCFCGVEDVLLIAVGGGGVA